MSDWIYLRYYKLTFLPRIRQISDALGIFLGFVAVLSIQSASLKPEIEWRLMTATILIPTIALLTAVLYVPESPRWLLKKGRYSQALTSFNVLRPNSLIAAKDFIYTHAQLDVESRLIAARRKSGELNATFDLRTRLGVDGRSGSPRHPSSGEDPPFYLYGTDRTSYWSRLGHLFSDKSCRRALLCAAVAMLSQQFTG